MDRGIHIVTNQAFVDEYRVLVVVAFPGHKPDQGVAAKRNLAVAGGGAVGNDLFFFDLLPNLHNGALIDTGAMVGTQEFNQLIFIDLTVFGSDLNAIRADISDLTGAFGQHHHARVNGSLILHTGGHNRVFGTQQRHRLLLHVRAHEGTVGIVIFKEGNHGRGNRDHHFGRNVHIIGARGLNLLEAVAVAGIDLFMHEIAVFIQRFIGLRHNIIVFFVGGHVLHFVQHTAGLLVHLAEGGFNKAVLIDLGEGGKIRNQADIRAFGGLNGAHAAIVGIVYVTHLKRGTVTRQTAGAQRRQTAFVGKL